MSMWIHHHRAEAYKKKHGKKASKKRNIIDRITKRDPNAPKSLSKMNKAELIEKAKTVGLNLDENLSNKIMAKAIKEKMKADKIEAKEKAKAVARAQKEAEKSAPEINKKEDTENDANIEDDQNNNKEAE